MKAILEKNLMPIIISKGLNGDSSSTSLTEILDAAGIKNDQSKKLHGYAKIDDVEIRFIMNNDYSRSYATGISFKVEYRRDKDFSCSRRVMMEDGKIDLNKVKAKFTEIQKEAIELKKNYQSHCQAVQDKYHLETIGKTRADAMANEFGVTYNHDYDVKGISNVSIGCNAKGSFTIALPSLTEEQVRELLTAYRNMVPKSL